MTARIDGSISGRDLWATARRQHWVVTRVQLLAAGLTPKAIRHRVAVGRLHPVYAGIYAVGRADLTPAGEFMAAVLASGPGAALSHVSAAVQWGIVDGAIGPIHVSVPSGRRVRRRGITVHERRRLADNVTTRHGVPVTKPVQTLIDLATQRRGDDLDDAIDAADRQRLINPERLRQELVRHPSEPGVARLRATLTHHTRVDSRLERRLLALVHRAGLPEPLTQRARHGHRVDFTWPEHGVVVEADSLSYHRTAAAQSADIARDNGLVVNGLTVLRFSHAQVARDPDYVVRTLTATLARASAAAAPAAA
jgi:very-short-patch-repair endonuclease